MVIKPIPKHLLIHSVIYEEWQEGDGINTESGFKAPVTLNNARIQYLSNISKSNTTDQLLYDAMLFYDVVNSSSSAPFKFTNKSKITFDGQSMYVEKINPVEAFKLHHWEIGLI